MRGNYYILTKRENFQKFFFENKNDNIYFFSNGGFKLKF